MSFCQVQLEADERVASASATAASAPSVVALSMVERPRPYFSDATRGRTFHVSRGGEQRGTRRVHTQMNSAGRYRYLSTNLTNQHEGGTLAIAPRAARDTTILSATRHDPSCSSHPSITARLHSAAVITLEYVLYEYLQSIVDRKSDG